VIHDLSQAFAPGRWRASWIWADDAHLPEVARRFVALRTTVECSAPPDSAPARMFADSAYALWVNGVDVARGPVRINPRRSRFDTIDLGPHLVPGTNTIAVLACFYAVPTAWWMPAPTAWWVPATDQPKIDSGGFVLEADLGDDGWLVTDASWRARLLEGWSATEAKELTDRGRELADLRSLPDGWQAPGFDDSRWAGAEVLSGSSLGEPGRQEPPSYPRGPMEPRPIGWPTIVSTVLDAGEGEAFVAGRVVAGTVELDLEGPAGSEVAFHATEFVADDGTIPGDLQGATLVLDGTRRTYETFDTYGLAGLRVDAPDGVTLHSVTVHERLYPVVGDAFFECSDETLNQIWAVGRRTVSLCSFDAYLDCPTREQRAWTGDSVVHQMVDLTTNTDWRLARWHPLLTANPRADGMLPMAVAGDVEVVDIAVIPDWALHWIHSVANLWRYVGDAEEIRRLMPVAEGVLRWFDPFVNVEGLLADVIGFVIIDWASVHTEGVSGALNGLWGRALLEFAAMSAWLGDHGRERWALATHARLAHGFEQLWDTERGRYIDSLVAGVQRAMASQHTQAAAIVGGLAPTDRHARLVDVLTDESSLVYEKSGLTPQQMTPNRGGGPYAESGPEPWWDVDREVVRAQPFFRYVVHDAIAQTGRADLIAGLCRDWSIALERCDTSWTEVWDGGTVSHGWSSTPTRDLMIHVLGVEPAEPGFAIAKVNPNLGDLAWARGAVPCPAGLIRIEVDHDELRVDCPIPFLHAGTHHPAGQHRISLDPIG